MVLKAALKVQLLANDVVVAESDSASLWHSVLQAMDRDEPLKNSDARRERAGGVAREPLAHRPAGDGISLLARDLGVDSAVVEAACGPTASAPYIHLDRHHWEALRKNTGERGPKAVAPAVLAATLLALWWKHAGQEGAPTISDLTPVLNTISLPAYNVKRSLDNCRWLQLRGKSIALNPSRTSWAITVARAYCMQEEPNLEGS